MIPINPVTEQACRDHFGKPVLIVLRDGSELVATLNGFEDGKLVLNTGEGPVETSGSVSKKPKIRSAKGKPKKKAVLKAVAESETEAQAVSGPIAPHGNGFTLATSAVGLLFVLT